MLTTGVAYTSLGKRLLRAVIMDATGVFSETGKSETNLPCESICIGQSLHEARLRAGLELFQVSADLKISTEYLKAIEEMDRASLPHQTYTLGFVRCYADYLGFNAQQSVDLFKADGSRTTTKHSDILIKSPPFWLKFSVPRGFGLTVALIGMLALASWFGQRSMATQSYVPAVPEMLGNWSQGSELQNIPAINVKPAAPEQIAATDG
ncbi:helix-turn-helix domain-containing protein [Oceanicaulis sp. AH-315-P02]|nr:helix-turn-helix domain-containing protein [Oceanicaulis sp. AH-315-P02]